MQGEHPLDVGAGQESACQLGGVSWAADLALDGQLTPERAVADHELANALYGGRGGRCGGCHDRTP